MICTPEHYRRHKAKVLLLLNSGFYNKDWLSEFDAAYSYLDRFTTAFLECCKRLKWKKE